MKFGSLGLEHRTSLEDKLLQVTSLIHTSIYDTGYVQREFFNYRYNNAARQLMLLFVIVLQFHVCILHEIEMWLHDAMWLHDSIHSTIVLFPIAATWIIQNEIVTTSFQD